jgi:hypothetical protein
VRINITCHEATNTITLHADGNLHIAHSEVSVKQIGGRYVSSEFKGYKC